MAIYHLRVKFVKRSEGRSAVRAAAYRSGTKLFDERLGKTENYTFKHHIGHTEIALPDAVPERMQERGILWNTIETGISHPRGQPAMEVECALPRELSEAQQVALCRAYARDMFVARGAATDICIHHTHASDGGKHPHVHFLISTRGLTAEGKVGKTLREMQDSPKLLKRIYWLEDNGRIDEALTLQKGTNLMQWRKAWEDYSNRFLDEAGETARIDHRTNAAQQIEREATPNIGFAIYGALKGLTGHVAERVQEWQARRFRNSMRSQMDRIREQRPDLTAEFMAHAREYAKRLFPELGVEAPERGLDMER